MSGKRLLTLRLLTLSVVRFIYPVLGIPKRSCTCILVSWHIYPYLWVNDNHRYMCVDIKAMSEGFKIFFLFINVSV